MNIIGIDLGTTKTVAAVFRNNRFEIIPDSKGRLSIPSLVFVTPGKEIFVGWEAKMHPQRFLREHVTISSIKRILGKKHKLSWENLDTKTEEIAALILARLKMEVEKYIGYETNEAVIAIPAHFDINQRSAVKQAAEIAGITVKRLVNEATAVAAFFTHNINTEGTALVVDIGGGSTDVSIIRYGDGVLEVLSTAGYCDLGGEDIDQILIDHTKKIINNIVGKNNLITFQELVLNNAVATAKIELSDSLETRIYLPAFIRKEEKIYDDLDIVLTRELFNGLIDPMLKRIISLIDHAIQNSEIEHNEIDTLILVGGTSRIPKIREAIYKHIGLKPRNNIDPIECVAKGAALCAGVLNGNVKDVLLLDTCPSSICIEGPDGKAMVIIKKDTTIPVKCSEIFTTVYDHQKQILIRIYEGESEQVNENTFIGELLITEILIAKKGIPKIEVTIDIDANSIIHASAKDMATNKTVFVRITAPFKLNADQISNFRNSVSEVMRKYNSN